MSSVFTHRGLISIHTKRPSLQLACAGSFRSTHCSLAPRAPDNDQGPCLPLLLFHFPPYQEPKLVKPGPTTPALLHRSVNTDRHHYYFYFLPQCSPHLILFLRQDLAELPRLASNLSSFCLSPPGRAVPPCQALSRSRAAPQHILV